MLCKIADLIAEIPEAGGLAPRCREYLYHGKVPPQIVIREEDYRPQRWPSVAPEYLPYMESGGLFYLQLLRHNGMMLHSSAVELDGRVYLFSGNCGAGKSTHTRLWQQVFGAEARIINDDKPALRLIDGVWYAYGTPWCGKDGINQNRKAPVAGICFMKQADHNAIRHVTGLEAMAKIMKQTQRKFRNPENLDLLLSHLEKLVQMIPVYELENRPEPEAARLSYETMRRGAEEMGL